MIKECVVLDGKIINIGPWDYQVESDESGVEVIGNPVPEGATTEHRDFEYDPDSGWHEVGAPAPKTDTEKIAELQQLVADLASLTLGV